MTDSITVQIKRLANQDDLALPTRMTEAAAGFDLPAAVTEPRTIAPMEIAVIPCGFAMAMPHGFEAQVRPRSGLSSKHGVTVINAPGTIDADYRGEIAVPLINLGKEPFVVTRGMRIAQMVVCPVPAVQFVQVESLNETTRGTGGFGHTGH